MFRKKQDVAERSRSLLKNSAAKKIKTEILAALPALTKDVLDEIMPNKVMNIDRDTRRAMAALVKCYGRNVKRTFMQMHRRMQRSSATASRLRLPCPAGLS